MPGGATPTVRSRETPAAVDDTLNADRIQVDMAAAEEREQIRPTIARLEARVAQLDATLAAVVRTAASGIESLNQNESITR